MNQERGHQDVREAREDYLAGRAFGEHLAEGLEVERHQERKHAQRDPKPPPRVKDPDVYTLFHRAGYDCLACGNRHVQAAHLLRGKDREDDIRGLIPLCGPGRCHDAFDKAQAYRGDFGHRFTPAQVKHAVARHLRHEAGDDNRLYLEERLGKEGAEVYIERLEAA